MVFYWVIVYIIGVLYVNGVEFFYEVVVGVLLGIVIGDRVVLGVGVFLGWVLWFLF